MFRALRARCRRRRDRGAALLLVVMVVPALSLLGMGLLSSATLEGDRAKAQLQLAQSFYYAEGGVARGRWVLDSTQNLGQVGQQLPAGIVAMTATQGGQTTGTFTWNGGNISLVSTGAAGPYQRKVQTHFQPQPPVVVDLKNLITSPGLVDVKSSNPVSTVNGKVLTGDAGTTLSGVLGTHPITVANVGNLSVPAAIALIKSLYSEVTVTSNQINNSSLASPYVMDGSVSTAVYYTNDPGFVMPNGSTVKCVQISGEVIWLVENGWWVGKQFVFQGVGANPRLFLLVSEDPNNGTGFDARKEIDASTVNLLLVTDGDVDWRKECTLGSVSMYGGEQVGAEKGQIWGYDTAVMDPWIDSLQSRNLLPLASNPTGGVLLVAGSWDEVP